MLSVRQEIEVDEALEAATHKYARTEDAWEMIVSTTRTIKPAISGGLFIWPIKGETQMIEIVGDIVSDGTITGLRSLVGLRSSPTEPPTTRR